MAKNRSRPKANPAEGQGGPSPTASRETAAGSPRPARWLRVLISLLVVWHVFVVFISPFAVPPASILVASVAYSDYVRWYSDTLYLNHGYHFFGPDPPINQLVRYRVTDAAGETVSEGEFPNTDQQWPRLYYHRHMMLADQASGGPPDVPPEEWLRLTLRAYGRHLLRRHEGDRVTVDYVAHLTLRPDQVLDKVDPNDPNLFRSIMSIEETAAGLAEPLPVPQPPPQEPASEPLPSEPLPPVEGLP